DYLDHMSDCYFRVWDPNFWAHHRKGLATIGYCLPSARLFFKGLWSLAAAGANPRRLFGFLRRSAGKIKQRLAPAWSRRPMCSPPAVVRAPVLATSARAPRIAAPDASPRSDQP